MNSPPDPSDTLFARCHQLIQSGAVGEVDTLLTRALADPATRPEALLWRGILALRARAYPNAFLFLANAQALLPERTEVLALLARAARGQGATAAADALAELALERDFLNPDLPVALAPYPLPSIARAAAEPSNGPPWTPPPPPRQEPSTQPVDVLVPVYRGCADTLACLDSLLAARAQNETPHEIIVLDDASPEPELTAALESLARSGAVTLVRHAVNLGFIRGMNRGMARHPDRDVVWLNADTRVCGDWLDRLRDAAYRDPDIASVTPFSNCGELMSFPTPGRRYPLPDAATQATLDALARRLWNGETPTLEVGCGFCLYVKRRALAEVGYLDEIGLIDGYGEDTDWCLRAKARGWRHAGAPHVFVAHRGGVSFGPAKRWRVARNNAVLRQRFPKAEADYRAYVRRDPLGPFRERWQRARLSAARATHRPREEGEATAPPAGPLHLLGPDGLDDPRLPFYTPPEALPPDGLRWLAWRPAGERLVATLGAAWSPLPLSLDYRLPDEMETLLADLASLPLSGLVFHQLVGCPFLTLPERLRLPYVLHGLDDAVLDVPTAFAHAAAAVLAPFQALLPRYAAVHPQARFQVASPPASLPASAADEDLTAAAAVAIADRLESARIGERWVALARHFARTGVGPRLLLLEATPWEQELLATGQVFHLPVITGLEARDLARLTGCRAAVSLDEDPGAGWMAPSLARRLNLPLYAPPSAVGEEVGARVLAAAITASHPAHLPARVLAPDRSIAEAPSSIVGALTGLVGDMLHGWALDRAAPDARLCVEVYLDDAAATVVRADRFQGTAAAEGLEGDGFHGFAMLLRPGLLRRARRIAVRVANQGPWLPGALRLPEPKASSAVPPTSQAWFSGGLRMVGWVWDPEAPDRHVEVTVREGERVLARTTANRRHPALVQRAADDHGFAVDLPWSLADGQRHDLSLESDRGQPLTDSPITVCCHPEGLAALLHRLWPAPATGDDPARALLVELAAAQDRRAPRSAGFAHYPEWFATFEAPGAPAATRPRVGVLLLTAGTDAGAAVSQASAAAQRLPAAGVWPVATARLQEGLEMAFAALGDDGALVPLWAGDRLAPQALDHLAALLTDPAVAWGYADCDQDGPEGERAHPWFKPAWDPALFFGVDLVSTGAIFRVRTLRAALALLARPLLDWSQLLAAVVATGQGQVAHGPRVLYHRRRDAPAWPQDAPPDGARLAALQWLAERQAPGATVTPLAAWPGLTRVRWPLPEPPPRVSLIVPTRDQAPLLRACLEGLLHRTDYPDLEILVVDNDSIEMETRDVLSAAAARGVRVLAHPQPFNYAAINNRAVAAASGTVIGLLNNDVEVLDPAWLREMVSQLARPGVGAVGAKLLWPNGMVQHGGVVIGIEGLAAHVGNTWHDGDPGYLGFNQLVRRYSAATAACLIVRKADYAALGGLDEQAFPVAFNDVDFCLRLRERGWAVIWTPAARLMHRESASRGKEDRPEKVARALREQANLRRRWAGRSAGVDGAYHPSLNGDWSLGPFGGLALPPGRRGARIERAG